MGNSLASREACKDDPTIIQFHIYHSRCCFNCKISHVSNNDTILTIIQSGVAYVMYTEVFSLDSKTAHFNRAVDQVRNDPRCTELLGEGKKIAAYGEPTWNKWARARPIA